MRPDVYMTFSLMNETFDFDLYDDTLDIDLDIEEVHIDIELNDAIVVRPESHPYEGAYKVTPAISSQTLPTQYKYLRDDITVLEIPYYEVSNPKGTTVIIGGV